MWLCDANCQWSSVYRNFEIIINIFLSDVNNFSESSYKRGSLIEGCGRDHGRDNCPLPEKFT